jgi:hypothetical protein
MSIGEHKANKPIPKHLSKVGTIRTFPMAETFCHPLNPSLPTRLEYFHELDLRRLDHLRLSEDVQLLELNFSTQLDSALDQLTKVKVPVDLQSQVEGTVHALLYWYEISNGGIESLSLRDCAGGKVSAHILREPIKLAKGERMRVQCSLYHGDVVFQVVESDNSFL